MIKIIPAIDLIDGACVRLVKGDYTQKKVYAKDPLEMAQKFEQEGIQYLHLVDLDGAKARAVQNWEVLEKIAKNTELKIDFSGGVRSIEAVKRILEMGANQVTIGTMAVRQEAVFKEWIQTYGAERFILAADVKDEEVFVSGWKEATGVHIDTLIQKYLDLGIEYVLCTDISKDGCLEGSSIELYTNLIQKFPQLKLIASGGVANLEEIQTLDKIGCWGVVVGKAIYENRIQLEDLATFSVQ